MSLDALIDKLRHYIKKHHKFGVGLSPISTYLWDDERWDPFWGWNTKKGGYAGADVNGNLSYNLNTFNASDTWFWARKTQILADKVRDENPTTGWHVVLLQSGENGKGIRGISRNGDGKTEGIKIPRPDVEAGKTAHEYAKEQVKLSSDVHSPYYSESGMLPEDWIVAFMTHHEETGGLMDNFRNSTDSIAILTGASYSFSGGMPGMYWDSNDWRANLSLFGFDDEQGVPCGIRSVVTV
ncbi:hypothetical protein EPN81_03105 [Patescibacteria group bacterium]|nr:MAG: hypothetical protein EPN81_03105 [Patescibacteria group bacterium]